MKQCPQCKLVYADETLNYCLEDGTVLTERAADSEPATKIIPSPHVTSEDQTRSFRSSDFLTGNIPAIPQTPHSSKTRSYLVIAAVGVLILFAGILGYRYLSSANSGQIESLAIMPFENASGNQELEYLSDGVTESLINSLSQISKLSVKARSSVFRYKGKDIEPQQVAADLKVQAVLNGRVTQRGDNLTISLDLVDGATGNQIWGEQYARKAGDLAAVQSEIARDLSQKLRARLTGAEENKIVKNQTQNTEAYQLYLQGRYNWNKRTDQTTAKAIEYFQQAIEKDPNYAMAYVGLAESYVLSGADSDDVLFPKVKAAALKAIELDPTLGEPHAALATYYDTFERDHVRGEAEFKKAIELSPNYSTTYHWWAETLVTWGRFDEGLNVYRKALEIDPFSLAIGTDYGMALYYARQYDQSIDHLKKLIEIDPTYNRTFKYLARVYQTVGRFEDALDAHEKRLMLEGANPEDVAKGKQAILNALKTSGPKGYWSEILKITLENEKKGKARSPSELARIYARLGLRDEAFKMLESALQNRINDDVFTLKVSPEWDEIRADPRFAEIVKKIGLP
ncbi:MAG: TPR end-of-group domain-containing protein [Pyrinomonadaceae bacterium]